jgi:four helix bundle protein
MTAIRSHRELRVYQTALEAAVVAIRLADRFPPEEKFGWRAQVRGCAASVCANIAEAFRKRRYKSHFISKLTDAEAEAAETQVWMELGWRMGYLQKAEFEEVFDRYEKVLAQLVLFEQNAKSWGVPTTASAVLIVVATIATIATIAAIAL